MQRTKTHYLLFVVVVIILNACGSKEQTDLKQTELKQTDLKQAEENKETAADQPVKEKETADLVIYVCGEVNRPGVYELPRESRIYQALEAAGGLKETAAGTYLNQAELVSDGQSIYVPSQAQVEEGLVIDQNTAKTGSSDSTKVNLNTAAKEELMTLTGIGESKADSIIEYRETNGNFQNIEEIKNIPGIKDGVYQKIKDQISV